MVKGKIWKFGHDIDTDQIIPSQYLLLPTIEQMKEHTFEALSNQISKHCEDGDVILAGKNFGCGSSREQAPRVLKAIGVGAVIAMSFARIFFRNAINIGLPLIQCAQIYKHAEDGDTLQYSISDSRIFYKSQEFYFEQYPEHILQIIEAGGLIEYVNVLDAS